MAKHDVALNISHPISVGNSDIEIVVRQDDKACGRVKISRGSIDWLPAHKQKTHWMDWNQFSRLMSEQGTRSRERWAASAVPASVPRRVRNGTV